MLEKEVALQPVRHEPIKGSPDYHRAWVLHSLHTEGCLEPVRASSPSDSFPRTPNELESALIQEHDLGPVLGAPVKVI